MRSAFGWALLVGLTLGYTGHTWFLYQVDGGVQENILTTLFDQTDNWNAQPTERFAWAMTLNRELETYGRAVTQLLSTGLGWVTDAPIALFHPPRGMTAFDSAMDPYLESVDASEALLGFFADRHGDRYVIVQNPNHTGGSIPNRGDGRLQATRRFDFSSATGVSTGVLEVLRPMESLRRSRWPTRLLPSTSPLATFCF